MVELQREYKDDPLYHPGVCDAIAEEVILRFEMKERFDMEFEDNLGCGSGRSGCGNAPSDPHLCPYSVHIESDHETECTCCEDCQIECADDI